MLAALADYGGQQAHYATAGGGLGCRHDAGESPLHRPGASGGRIPPGLAIVADVRLDDRAALGDALGVPRRQIAGLLDAALVLHAYLRWGEECPSRLFGDFAFAIWDEQARTFFCARDHVGVRPFYYAAGGGHFSFASAVEGVLAGPGVSTELDEASVAAWLSLRHSAYPASWEHTFFRQVRKLLPGHSLLVRLGVGPSAGLRPVRYWRPERLAGTKPASDGECAEEFLHLYSASVKARLGPGRVGVEVSGGLDSSSVAVLAARELHRQGRASPIAFSYLAPPTPSRLADVAYAKEHAALNAALSWAAAGQNGSLPLCYCPPRTADLVADLSRDGALRPGLTAPTVRRAGSFGVRTVLSGFGGDQAASHPGTGHYDWLLLRGRWVRLLQEIRALGDSWPRVLAAVALRVASPAVAANPRRFLNDLRRFVTGAGLPRTAYRRRRWLIDPGFARRMAIRGSHAGRFTSVRNAQLYALQEPGLVHALERQAVDGAASGIDFRYPLLDRRLLEFVLCLPPEQFRRGPWGRYLMRTAMAGERGGNGAVLPPEIAWGRKLAPPTAAGRAALEGALPLLRQRWQASKRQPSRAGYVDMARLNACLMEAELQQSLRQPLLRALSFLDFH